MSYIGQVPALGNYRKLDSITAQFDGVKTQFEVTVDGVPAVVNSIRQCISSLNGVIQEPGQSINVGTTSTSLLFSEAPAAGDTFWCIIIGDGLDIGEVADNSVTTDKLVDSAVTSQKIATNSIDANRIQTSAVTTNKINDAAVTNQKIADNAVTLQKIQNSAVTTDKVANEAITLEKIAAAVINSIREIPEVVANSTRNFALTDNGKHVKKTDTSTPVWTIPPNGTTAFPIGTAITVVNIGASGNVSIERGSGVELIFAGDPTGANRTLLPSGMGTLLKVGTNLWYLSGSGVA